MYSELEYTFHLCLDCNYECSVSSPTANIGQNEFPCTIPFSYLINKYVSEKIRIGVNFMKVALISLFQFLMLYAIQKNAAFELIAI